MFRLAKLARTSLQTQGSLARQTVDLTWGSVVKDLDRVSANRAYAESVARESARYWRTVGGVGVDCAGDLITIGRSLSVNVLRAVAAAGRMARARTPLREKTIANSVAGVTPIRRAQRRTLTSAGAGSAAQGRLIPAGGERR